MGIVNNILDGAEGRKNAGWVSSYAGVENDYRQKNERPGKYRKIVE